MKMLLLAFGCAMTLASAGAAAQQATVKIEPQAPGSRTLEKTTEAVAIRDYLQAWDSLSAALNTNQAALLDPAFVGQARDKLAETVAEQLRAGLRTQYRPVSHDLQFVFYSPEGQSLELVDTAEYDQQVLSADKTLATERVKARYLVVLTPAEVRWRVRVLQAELGK